MTPDYIFECSWEVCNKMGGIYTVLSTKARTLQQQFADRAIYIGPGVGKPNPEFIDDATLFPDWVNRLNETGQLHIKAGRWNIPGNPPVVLIDYQSLFCERNSLYFSIWESFGVDSSRAYGDYDESCIFAYAAAQVILNFHTFYNLAESKVIAHFHEWMLGMGLLFVQKHCPSIATVFTTHATSIGRSIAGNNKPLYNYMHQYHGDQMAQELNMEAKHSLEKQTARFADCFTTVSDITALECKQLLEKTPDVIMPNGFEPGFVPPNKLYAEKRNKARTTLLNVVAKLTGQTIDPQTFLVATSGRYEYRNKGIDVYIDAINRLRNSNELQREVIAFLMVPAYVYAPRADLKEVVDKNIKTREPMQMPFLTHWLHQMNEDRVMNFILHAGFTNDLADKVKIIFVPCYLDGHDGILNLSYYDLLIGMDATVFPSYYEPWGYTPLESIAFGIPTITTDLAGFGLWAKNKLHEHSIDESKGKPVCLPHSDTCTGQPVCLPNVESVTIIPRTDENYSEVVSTIAATLLELTKKDPAEIELIRNNCRILSAKAKWEEFISHYYSAYHAAFINAARRTPV